MKTLFICNQNENRSKTAELLFRDLFETKSAGLFNKNPVSEKELNWADLIIVMEESQRKILSERFPKIYIKKQILNFNIPDIYKFNDTKLIRELNNKINQLVPEIS